MSAMSHIMPAMSHIMSAMSHMMSAHVTYNVSNVTYNVNYTYIISAMSYIMSIMPQYNTDFWQVLNAQVRVIWKVNRNMYFLPNGATFINIPKILPVKRELRMSNRNQNGSIPRNAYVFPAKQSDMWLPRKWWLQVRQTLTKTLGKVIPMWPYALHRWHTKVY